MAFAAIGIFRDGIPEGHVIPNHDEIPHDAARECWCEPVEKDEGVWTHRDLLAREGPRDPDGD